MSSRFAIAVITLLLGLLSLGAAVEAKELLPHELDGVTLIEQLGKKVDPGLRFTDHDGREVALGDYLGDKPVLLTLNYYTCGTICGVQLSGVMKGLQELDLEVGEDFRVVTVSIDHRETAAIARDKRLAYASAMEAPDSLDWNFLVGDEASIEALADSVGFVFKYDATTDQFAHPGVIMFLAPDGTVARYLYGIDYPARDLRFALVEASQGRVGSSVDKLILSCFRFDMTSGRYTPHAFGIMRIGAVFSMFLVAGFTLMLWRQDKSLSSSGRQS